MENSDTIYIHCKTEKAVQYIHRKKAKVDNTEIKTKPFIPPQLYGRYEDLSKHTYEARKENELLKTQIRLGEDDLILLVKHKGDRDWEVEPNMSILGPIREPEWHRLWPAPNVPDLSSLPKGRNYGIKETHKLSDSSSDESDAKKHKLDKSDQSDKSEKSDKSDKPLSPEKSKTGKVQQKSKSEKVLQSSSKQSENSSVLRMASIFNTQKKSSK